MRPGRQSLFLVAALALLLAGTSVWAGSFEDPEISDEGNDTAMTVQEGGPWADLRRVWIVESSDALQFHVNVSELTDHDGGEQWDVNFTVNDTNWTVRASFDGDAFSSQIREDDSEVDGAETTVSADNNTIQVDWTTYQTDIGSPTLTDLFAHTADSNVLPLASLDPCHGEDVIDCAPADGEFGRDFDVGEQPAEGLNLDVTPSRVEAKRGENATFTLSANNTDDDPVDATYNITVPDEFDATLDDANVSLDPGGSDERTLTVQVGENATANATHQIQVDLVPTEGRNRSQTVEVSVPPPPPPPPPFDLSMTIRPLRADLQPGETATFTVDVINDGTNNDTVDLDVASGPGWAILSERRLRLAAGGNDTVTVEIQVPDEADDGTYEHRIQATSSGGENVTSSATATVEVSRPGGFVNELDRDLKALGLGGLLPALVLLGIVVLAVIVFLVVAFGGEDHALAVDADWSETEPGEDDEGGDEGG